MTLNRSRAPPPIVRNLSVPMCRLDAYVTMDIASPWISVAQTHRDNYGGTRSPENRHSSRIHPEQPKRFSCNDLNIVLPAPADRDNVGCRGYIFPGWTPAVRDRAFKAPDRATKQYHQPRPDTARVEPILDRKIDSSGKRGPRMSLIAQKAHLSLPPVNHSPPPSPTIKRQKRPSLRKRAIQEPNKGAAEPSLTAEADSPTSPLTRRIIECSPPPSPTSIRSGPSLEPQQHEDQACEDWTLLAAEKVLVIEDTAAHMQAISRMLTKSGFQVVQAEDGQQGLDAMCSNLFHFVICDYEMPKMDGREAVRCLRSWEVGNKKSFRQLIIMHASSEEREKLKDVEYDLFVPKPFSASKLFHILQNPDVRLRTER